MCFRGSLKTNRWTFHKVITVYNQALLKSDGCRYPPDALCHEDVQTFSSVRYYLFKTVYDDIMVICECNSHLSNNIVTNVCGCRYTNLMDS